MLKIGLLTPAWPGMETPNGIVSSIRNLSLGLKDIGHQPIILAMTQDGEPLNGIPFKIVGRRSWSMKDKLLHRLGSRTIVPRTHGQAIADSAKAVRDEHGLDVFVMEDTQGWAVEMQQARICPIIVTLRGPWLLHHQLQSQGDPKNDACRIKREIAGYSAADGIVALSKRVLDEMQTRISFADKPVMVIPNSILAGEPPKRRDSNQILFVGRFDLHKGGDTVIDAFAHLVRDRPDARLTFVGPDRGVRQPDGRRLSLDEKMATLDAQARAAINVLGQQSAAQIIALRQTHPIAVMGSRFEVFGNVILEAMVAGQAIVATSVGGPEEIVEDSASALLVAPDDPIAMSDALKRLLDDPSEAQKLGQAARRRVENAFAPQAIAHQTATFVKSILGNR